MRLDWVEFDCISKNLNAFGRLWLDLLDLVGCGCIWLDLIGFDWISMDVVEFG